MKVDAQIRYERLARIGELQGRNSEVYRIRDPQLGADLVAKEMPKAGFADAAAFWRECQTVYGVESDHIVPVLYGCETADTISVIMPFYENGSLADKLEKGPLTVRATLKVADQVLRAVADVHERGLLHFDIKPSNVLFDDTGRARLADFGQARAVAFGRAVAPRTMYTWVFAPEVLKYGYGVVQTDVWQVGVLIYRCLLGDSAFDRRTAQFAGHEQSAIVSGSFPDLSAVPAHTPLALRRVLKKALALNPAERYRDVTSFRKALAKVGVGVDWHMEELANGDATWTGKRHDGPDYELRLWKFHGDWHVEFATVSAEGVRRRRLSDCVEGVTQKQAHATARRLMTRDHR